MAVSKAEYQKAKSVVSSYLKEKTKENSKKAYASTKKGAKTVGSKIAKFLTSK